MPTVIRRSGTVRVTARGREVRHAVGWQVTTGMWSPPTDVCETDQEYIVSVEVAGMRERDFEVVLENGILSVTGHRPDVSERRAYHQMEIHFGEFSTAAGVPGPVDVDRSVAEYTDGFLIVRMPKAKTTEIKIEE
jgi:HSP20 family protein